MRLGDILAAVRALAPPLPGLGSVDHIGVKVADFEAMGPELGSLGLRVAALADHPAVGLRIAFLEGGDVPVELLSVRSPESPLAGDPDGLHHVAYRVAGLRALIGRLGGDRRLRFDGGVRVGAGGHEIATFRMHGAPVAYELVESAEAESR